MSRRSVRDNNSRELIQRLEKPMCLEQSHFIKTEISEIKGPISNDERNSFSKSIDNINYNVCSLGYFVFCSILPPNFYIIKICDTTNVLINNLKKKYQVRSSQIKVSVCSIPEVPTLSSGCRTPKTASGATLYYLFLFI